MPKCKYMEYGIYIAVLLVCISILYWQFWYRPQVDPVVMIDPAGLAPKGQAIPTPLLDPEFRWSLVQIVNDPPMVIFKQDDTGKSVTMKIGDEVQGWTIKSINRTMVVLENTGGDVRALFYSSK